MILTIAQYIEALASPDGRWRTLRRLHPVADAAGRPMFAMPWNGTVDFEVTADGVRQTLRCPLVWDADAPRRMAAFELRQKGLGGRFYSEWRVLRSEAVVFDDDGRGAEVDILARQVRDGEPLVDFLERATAAGDTGAMEAARESFDRLVEWAGRVDRGGISLRRLVASPAGDVGLTAFSATDDTDAVYDLMGRLGRRLPSMPENDAAEPPRPVPHGYESYEEYTWDDYWGVATVMNEGCWSLIDAGGRTLTEGCYDWLGECSEGLLLAQKGDKCGFVDLSGREIYDDASSFSEGCALVTLAGESYLIDPRGNRI